MFFLFGQDLLGMGVYGIAFYTRWGWFFGGIIAIIVAALAIIGLKTVLSWLIHRNRKDKKTDSEYHYFK